MNSFLIPYRSLDEELTDEIANFDALVQFSLHHPEIL